MWLLAAGAIVLSIALYVVPQLLRDWFDPAWSMLLLMVVDAGVVALIVRSRTALLVEYCSRRYSVRRCCRISKCWPRCRSLR